MAEIRRFPGVRHLRAEPNVHILQFRRGKLRRSGEGVAFWFHPLSAAIAEVPIDDRDLLFTFHGRSSDFQDVMAQGVIAFRVSDPATLAKRIDFSIDLKTGGYLAQPLEKLTLLLSQLAQQHAWAYMAENPVREILNAGQAEIGRRVDAGLKADPALAAMGLEIATVTLSALKPTTDLENALEAPTREAIQQEADQAAFERRAAAVEKERAIAENELQTEIELAMRKENLIAQEGSNSRRKAEEEATASRIEAESTAENESIVTAALAERVRLEAGAEADATRLTGDADAQKIRAIETARLAAEEKRLEAYGKLPSTIAWALAAKEVSRHLKSVDHINLTPDLLTPLIGRLVEAGTRKIEGEG